MAFGRTPLFRKLIQTLHQADWLNRHPGQRQLFWETRETARVSRRDFVRLLGAAGLVSATGTTFAKEPSKPQPPKAPDPSVGKIAILGGGVAGLTAAYRLMKGGVPCEIFEASERLGGRILTKYDFNDDKMFCELGGELVDSGHKDLARLAAELGVGIQEMKGQNKGVDLYYFGGRHYSDEQLIPAFAPFAKHLAADKKSISDRKDQLIPEKAARFDHMSLAEYLTRAGKGVEPWVVEMLRVAYVIEYGREAEEQSSLNLITYLDPETKDGFRLYGESDESKRIKGGSSALTTALAKALEGKVEIHQGHRLTQLADGAGGLELTFETGAESKTIKCHRALCTLPFTMLREVEGVSKLPLSKGKQDAIANLGYGNNAKVMLGFTERRWRTPEAGLPALSNGSFYTDLSLQCTWETSRAQEGKSGILTNYLGGNRAKDLTSAPFEKFLEELNQMVPGLKEKADGKRIMMNWPEYKFTKASYSCPLVGQYLTLLEPAATPELHGRLLFAGEHTSADFSGFMNGAIQTGNTAAEQLLEPSRKHH